jgi:biopolymer transport protein ExbD
VAYRPSKRRQSESEWTEPNITPMMNLMVVLIPLLLSTAEFVRLGVIEINLPPAAVESQDAPLLARLDLAVTITDRGFFISSNLGVLSGARTGEPTIPLIRSPGDSLVHDYAALSQRLYEIKQKMREVVRGRGAVGFPDSSQIIITAEPAILYQTVISTMDAARQVERDGRWLSLFPEVSLSPGVY